MQVKKQISAEEFDRIFDEGGDISPYVDFSEGIKWFPIPLKVWALRLANKEAERLGTTREELMASWIMEHIEKLRSKGEKEAS